MLLPAKPTVSLIKQRNVVIAMDQLVARGSTNQ